MNSLNNEGNQVNQENDEREQKRMKITTKGETLVTVQTEKRHVITYCDLGCNEGDLTVSISKHLLQPPSQHENKSNSAAEEDNNKMSNTKVVMKCLGLDIDSTLIQRANHKYNRKNEKFQSNTTEGNSTSSNDDETIKIQDKIEATFETCNIANNLEFKSKCKSFLQQEQPTNPTKKRFDLISIFSTTMWIHIHHGDDGLKSLLQLICESCYYLIIEPQPSKCYRNVNTRLRKLNFEEVDVSLDTLKMRSDIENEIEKVIVSCGFVRVAVTSPTEKNQEDDNGNDSNKDIHGIDRTKWNRRLRLYKWIKSVE